MTTVQFSTAVRNARLDSVETVVGASPKLQIRTGAQPANCAAADTGTLLCEITCPADWMNDASGGTKTLKGSWSGTVVANGAPGHYRLKDNAGTTCHKQGDCTVNGGGGDLDLVIDGGGSTLATGGTVTISSWLWTEGNA